MRPHKILIVGGGVAGLAAAEKLLAAGQTVSVIEAREQLGGRVRTTRESNWPAPIEAGAEFLHGDFAPLEELLTAAGVGAAKLPDRRFRVADGRVRPVEFEHAWNRVDAAMRGAGASDMCFSQLLEKVERLTPSERAAAVDYVEGFNAADQHRLGVHWLRASETKVGAFENAAIRRVTTGFDRLVDELAVRCGDAQRTSSARVSAIRRRPGCVEVEFIANGTARTEAGDCVLVTLPLGVLKAPARHPSHVEFDPATPQ